jgi:hypothetical protein
MRLLHIDTGRGMQGGQWQALYLLSGLRGRGWDCLLLARGELAAEARQRGIQVEDSSFRNVFRHCRRAELVQAHDARAHTLAVAACAPKLIVSRRVAFPVKQNALSKFKYARADRFIAVSRYVAQGLHGPASVVHDGVPPLEGAAPNGSVLVFDKRRGDRLNLEALKRASIFVYLTDMDGLGSAALLAMSAGIPVIASNIGGLPEAVEHGVTGLLVDGAAEAVERAVAQLRGDPELARRMGEAGRARWAERFTVDHMVEGTIAVYRELLG